MRAILFVLFVCLIQSVDATTYYFSSVSGDDSRTSTQAKSSSTPWKSLSKLNSFFSNLQPGDAVLLKRGETFYGSIIVSKSGTSASPIKIGAYGSGSKPVITSLITLGSWSSKGNGIWESYNSSFGSSVNMVLLNNVAQELGRYPNSNSSNKGYLTYETHSSTYSITDYQLTSSVNWTGADVVIRGRRWILDRNFVSSHSGTKISYKASSSYSPYDKYGYFFENSIKTLDKFGEWYYNPSSKKLSVYFGSNSPSSYSVKAATKDNLIYCLKFSNIVFDNLDIKGANGSSVYIRFGSHVSLQNCDVEFSGMNGVEAKFHPNFRIENSTVSNSNNNGIDLGYSGDYAVIRNNKITNTAIFPGMIGCGDGKGIGIMSNGNYSIIEYNEIKNTGYTAICFNANYVTVKNNLIDNFCVTKDDGAGIYTTVGSFSSLTGRKVIGNIIINGNGAPEGTPHLDLSPAEGIYADNNASNVEVSGNTVANCGNQGIYVHCSSGIKITNNTLYNNGNRQLAMIEDGDNYKIRNCSILNNIVFSKSTSQLVAYIKTYHNDLSLFGNFDGNYYARPLDDLSDDYLKQVKVFESTPTFINFVNATRFEYNATKDTKTVTLDATYIDLKKKSYSGTITLQPFTSLVLIKSSSLTSTSSSPSVSITSPTTNSSFNSGATINISARASDADGSISKVEFYKGSTLMHIEYNSPYTYTWSNVSAGTYTITAKATDNSGHSTTSSGVKVIVGSSTLSARPSLNNTDTVALSILDAANNKLTDFRLYPNPAVNTIKMSFEKSFSNQKANLTIQNMAGSLLKSLPVTLTGQTTEIDISSLNFGTYILTLRGDNLNISKKFIKIN